MDRLLLWHFVLTFFLFISSWSSSTTAAVSAAAAFSGGQWAMLATQYGDNGSGGIDDAANSHWPIANGHWGTTHYHRQQLHQRHGEGGHPHHVGHHHHQQHQQQQQKCLDIPENFTLCHGMQYKTMRLPNLLEHDTLDEAIQQGASWLSLLRLHCHPHTKLFLCSLFAPVCLPQLERPIQPCRSLCTAVQQGCAARMAKYGFPWPEMLNCTRFAVDNDLCIKPPPATESGGVAGGKHSRPPVCKSCAQVPTFENLMDNFCRSSTVLKVRLRPLNQSHMVVVRKQRVFKPAAAATAETTADTAASHHHHTSTNADGRRINANQSGAIAAAVAGGGIAAFKDGKRKRKFRRQLQRRNGNVVAVDDDREEKDSKNKEKEVIVVRLAESGEGRCQCPFAAARSGGETVGTFLVMASERRQTSSRQQQLNAKLVIPWIREKTFKTAIRKFKRVNCNTLGREIRESVLSQMFKRQAA